MTDHSDLRIGDAEREKVIDSLNRHFAEGRLTRLEHEERTAAALTARTANDLDMLLADLPDLDGPGRAGHRPTGPLGPRGHSVVVMALLGAVVLAVLHLIPVFAVVILLFVAARWTFGWRHGWRRGAFPGHRC